MDYTLEITPEGIKENKRSFLENIKRIDKQLSFVKYIIVSEIKAKIFDKTLGILLLTTEPIITASLYYILTAVIFTFSGEINQFAYIFVAVVFWRWFGRTVDASPNAIASYGNVLKQTNFPISMVIVSFIGLECFYLIINFIVLVIFLAFLGYYPSISYIYLPVIVLTQFFLTFWIVLFFSMAGTFIKDLGSVLYALTSFWWYLSPGIYPVSRIPQKYLWIYNLNPFAHIFPSYQDVLIYGRSPKLIPLMIIMGFSIIMCFLGLRLLKKVKYHFFMYL